MDSKSGTPINKRIVLPIEFDPRSPTMDFDRTPIALELSNSTCCSIQSGQHASFKSAFDMSQDSFDMGASREDPSPAVSQFSMESETSSQSATISQEQCVNIVPENYAVTTDVQMEDMKTALLVNDSNKLLHDCTIEGENDSFVVTEASTPEPAVKNHVLFSNQKATPLKSAAAFTFHMDDENVMESSPQPDAKIQSPRIPLAALNKPTNSPLNIIRAKQWKDFNEEREKLGLHNNENVLPPFKTAPSSVPSKKPIRRRPLV